MFSGRDCASWEGSRARRSGRFPCYARPRVTGTRGIVVNRLSRQHIAFVAGLLVLCACRAGGQTMPLRDPSAAHKTLAPLTATNPVVRDGLFTIDVVVTDAAENLVSDLAPPDFTLLDNGQPAKIRTLHNSLRRPKQWPDRGRSSSSSSTPLIFRRLNSRRPKARLFVFCAGTMAISKTEVFSTGLRGMGCIRRWRRRGMETCSPKKWSSTSLRGS